jgi:enoyl-CoA hydratase
MTYRDIIVERRGKIEIIRLNRPRYRNAQSRVMLEEMTEAFARADLDNDVSVIVLAAAGDHFSSGHDLGTPEEREDAETSPFGEGLLGRVNRSWHLYVENSLRWRDVKKPTIAQVQGLCIYGGFILASSMDVIFASDDAKFLPTHLQLHTAPWDMGIRNAKRILFENRFIPAEEAKSLGLVSEVVPPDQLEDAVMAQAERWAETDLLTLRMLKHSINLTQDAMGYRVAIHAAHSAYMVRELINHANGANRVPGERRMPLVADALAKEKRSKKS